MAVLMAKPAAVAPSATAPQRVGAQARAYAGASQPDFTVPEIDSAPGVGARAPDTDPNAGWLTPDGGADGRHRQFGQGTDGDGRKNAGDRVFRPQAVGRPTTVSDVILASQIVTRHIGPPLVPRSEATQAVGLYDHAIQAISGTLPVTHLGARLDVAL